MSRSYVFQQSFFGFRITVTIFAGKLPIMNKRNMPFQNSSRLHFNVADLTVVRFVFCVCSLVYSNMARSTRFIITQTAGIGFLSGVCPFVSSKMARLIRFKITQTAGIRFLSGVCPFVSIKMAQVNRFKITQTA